MLPTVLFIKTLTIKNWLIEPVVKPQTEAAVTLYVGFDNSTGNINYVVVGHKTGSATGSVVDQFPGCQLAHVGAKLVLTVHVVWGGERWLNALEDALVEAFKFVVAFEQQQPVEDVQVAEGSLGGEQGTELSIPAGIKHGRALLPQKDWVPRVASSHQANWSGRVIDRCIINSFKGHENIILDIICFYWIYLSIHNCKYMYCRQGQEMTKS